MVLVPLLALFLLLEEAKVVKPMEAPMLETVALEVVDQLVHLREPMLGVLVIRLLQHPVREIMEVLLTTHPARTVQEVEALALVLLEDPPQEVLLIEKVVQEGTALHPQFLAQTLIMQEVVVDRLPVRQMVEVVPAG